MKRLTELLSLAVLVLLTGCSVFRQEKTLRVGVSPNYPPLTFMKDGRLAGFEIDLIKKIARNSGRKIEFKTMPFTQLRRALLEKKIDLVIGGISVTAERQKLVSFTEPVIKGGLMPIIRKKDINKYSRIDMLKGDKTLRLGVENGTTGDDYATKNFPLAKVKRYDSADMAIWALKRNEVDIVIHDAPISWNVSKNELMPLYISLTTEYYAWAFRKGEEKKMEFLNTELLKLRTNMELRELWKKWVPSITRITYEN